MGRLSQLHRLHYVWCSRTERFPFPSKGSKVAIEGKLRWSQWERDGQKRSKIEVIVDEIEFMTSRNDGAPRAAAPMAAPMAQAPMAAAPMAAPVVDASVYDDDIPF